MNLRNVLRTYALLRSLTDDESALLETLRGLSESDREQLVESLSPSGGRKKKAAKKSSSKSPRASGMAAALNRSLSQQRAVTEPICATCGNVEDYVDHSEPSPSYHRFESSSSKAAAGAD
jgi:hypothetical protein